MQEGETAGGIASDPVPLASGIHPGIAQDPGEGDRVLMFGNLNPVELMVVGIVAVLLFGRRLPEVGRSLGKGIVEFKKGLRGMEDDFLSEGGSSASTYSRGGQSASNHSWQSDPGTATFGTPEGFDVSVPKFELPASAPTPVASPEPKTYQD